MSHIQSVVCWYIFLLFLMFWGVCSLVSSGMVSSCRSLSDHDWTFLFQLMIFVCGLRVLVRVYLRLVFFIFSLPLFFSCKCMLLFCNYISSFFLDLFFPLVPRVSWLWARGYFPGASDWLRGTWDPYFRNLYNRQLGFGWATFFRQRNYRFLTNVLVGQISR